MRIEQLNFTRFVAAMAIVIYHYGKGVIPFQFGAIESFFQQANVGVSYFFVLSGFVMILANSTKNKVNFASVLKRRWARIYPLYMLALVLLLTYYRVTGHTIDYKGLLLNLCLLQSWVPGFALSFNLPAWSLSVEMFFYVLFPLLFNQFYKRYSFYQNLIPISILFIGSQIALHALRYSTFYQGFPSQSHDLIYFHPLMHLNEFLLGNLAGLFYLKGLKVRNYDAALLLLLSLIPILLLTPMSILYHNGMLAFLFIPIILLLSANKGWLSKLLKQKTLIYLGEISYAIYILQYPIYSWVNGIFNHWDIHNSTLIFYTSVSVLLAASALSYRFVEQPLKNYFYQKQKSVLKV